MDSINAALGEVAPTSPSALQHQALAAARDAAAVRLRVCAGPNHWASPCSVAQFATEAYNAAGQEFIDQVPALAPTRAAETHGRAGATSARGVRGARAEGAKTLSQAMKLDLVGWMELTETGTLARWTLPWTRGWARGPRRDGSQWGNLDSWRPRRQNSSN